MNLSERVGRHAETLRVENNKERPSCLNRTVLEMFRSARIVWKMDETQEERVRRISEKKTQGTERNTDDKAKE